MKALRPAPGLPIEQQSEAIVARMLAYGEARGEGGIGMLAVLHVVHNRALHADTSFKYEALKKWQFSTFNDNDPNRDKLLTAYATEPASWAVVDAICAVFEAGYTTDPTKGARHYFVENMPNPPKWGPGHPDWIDTVILGRHRFGIAAS